MVKRARTVPHLMTATLSYLLLDGRGAKGSASGQKHPRRDTSERHTPPDLSTYATFWNGTTTPLDTSAFSSALNFGTSNDAVLAASFNVCIESRAYLWLTRGSL